jgi:DtxR family Mn-dependent transcriptional regulator
MICSYYDIYQGELTMVIHESAEDYLETILMLSKKLPVVRSIDIANEMGYKKSSVSIAMKNLREAEHIRVTKEGYIYLTDSGKEIAEMIYERHQILSSWLIKLGVDKKVAEEDACRIEHDISKESFNAIKKAISAQLKELENNKQ